MLIDVYRADYALRVSQDSLPPSAGGPQCIGAPNGSVHMVPEGMFELTDPRTMEDQDWEEFSADVVRNGVLVPIRYVEDGGRYWIVDGNHRLRAARANGLSEVPAERVTLPYGHFKTIEDLTEYQRNRP